jgi:hypothetical protein
MTSSNNSSVHTMNKTHAVTLGALGAVQLLSLQFSSHTNTHTRLTTTLYHVLISAVAISR